MSRSDQRAPIFIVAPWRRCGTTLIQRALNSSGEALIYGENFIFLENYPIIVAGVHTNLENKQKITASVREQVLGGDYNMDASSLFPDYAAYAEVTRSHFYAIAQYYERWTQDYGRHTWGVKHQIRRVEGFSSFMRLLPHARYIFVYRNVVDVARSDKARFPRDYPNHSSFAQLGRIWARNSDFLRKTSGLDILHIDYEKLSSDVSVLIEQLERHCGITGIRPEVFARKVNVSVTFDRLSGIEAETRYRNPAELSAQELSALQSGIKEQYRRFGSEIPQVLLG